MTVSIGIIQTTIELWRRRDAPEGPDVARALHIARILEDDSATPTFLRGIAWHLVEEIHEAAGWEIPGDVNLSQCRGAAASLEHASALLLGEIASEVAKSTVPVLVLSACSAGRSLFGRWDLLPANGALLVALVEPKDEDTYFDALPVHRGVRWGSAGSLFGLLDERSSDVTVGGLTVRVPKSELVAAQTSGCPEDPCQLETVLFCASAYASSQDGTWDDTLPIAQQLHRKRSPNEAVLQHELAGWLGIRIPPITRVRIKINRILRPNR